MRGKFITLEGIDGAGKSTHLARIVKILHQHGKASVTTREPGGSPLGERLREILLSQPMHLETEALLMFAARREHLDKLIMPALQQGKWVISDRFSDATYAYQGGGRGLAEARIEQLEDWVHPGFQPDLTLLFDLPPEIACQRLASKGVPPDRFEREAKDFFTAVRSVYLDRALQNPHRICVIDAVETIYQINVKLEQIIISHLF